MFETERLIIRKFTGSDWSDLHEYLSKPVIYRFEKGSPITSDEAKNISDERSVSSDFFAVVLKSNKKMIGHLYFSQTEPIEFATWVLGFIFNPDFHSLGFCTEASARIIQYAFEELNAHRITAYCNPLNAASWKVLEKIGMVKEGFFKERAFLVRDSENNPIWQDSYAYAILNRLKKSIQ